ncbi:MAG: RNA polymerase sigma factor [Armatimonadota bacterium]|nr:RNA polymerase sigma factor [Armatimonadota bacterium]
MYSSADLTFDSLAQQYRQPLTRAAYHLCGNLDDACDVVQETLLAAYRGFAGLRETEKAGAWFYSILRRKAVERRRAHKPEAQLLVEPTTAGPEDTESLVRGIILEQMTKLSREDREILAGKYLLGLSYRELAESIGIKEASVRVRSLRAKERLRGILRGVGVEVPESRRKG